MGKKRKSRNYWYGVKSLYRMEAVGEPRAADAYYDPEGTLIEERVVLVRASSDKEAVKKGAREADRYARDPFNRRHLNPYGQEVEMRRIRALQISPVMWPLNDGCEIWSDTEVFAATVTDAEIEDRRFGRDEPKALRRLRKKFLNREFSGDVMPASD